MEKRIPSKQETDLMLQEEFTDALFGLLADKALDRETRKFMAEKAEPPEELEIKTFSKFLDRSYTRYSRRKFLKRGYEVLSKVSVVIVVAIFAFSVAVLNVAAMREPLMHWVFQYYSDHTEISFPNAEFYGLPEITFGYIPDGFTELTEKGNSTGHSWRFTPEGNKEEYIHLAVDSLTGAMNVDTENAEVRYEMAKDGTILMITQKWYDDKFYTSFLWYDEYALYDLGSYSVGEEELYKIYEGLFIKK